ncbi:DUF4375 domain-containing protein [Granulicella sp. L46]|uniref:DMP19 family protein n=1 Tax=Granulicella sp. L46 TaxID=1641865 RepID=UPI00131D7FB1|nr:DUF4375 domain-containing protein [Granulicella sp. L46]
MSYEQDLSFVRASDLIEIYQGPEVFLRTFARADRNVGLLYAAHFAQSEICNGGFQQFFSNSTGVLSPEAISGMEAVNMPQTAALLQQAATLLGTPYPRERSQRQGKLKLVDPKVLNTINNKFIALISSENGGFESAAQAFLTAH